HQLGQSKSTFRRDLGRGRELLGSRLARRGVTLSAALLAPLLCESAAEAALPASLLAATASAVTEVAAGEAGPAAGLWAGAVTLADGLLRSGLPARLKPLGVLLLAALAAGVGAAVVTWAAPPGESPPPSANREGPVPTAERAEDPPAVAAGLAC